MRVLVKTYDLMGKMAVIPPMSEPTFALRYELFKLVRGMRSASIKRNERGVMLGVELHLEPLGAFSVLEVPEAAVKRMGRDPRGLILLTPKLVEDDPAMFVKGRKVIV